ncbi:MAG: YibE/F family protein [Clostridiales bacterium]|nr:YibE/F family protein [Clostridiales bacterium]
MNKRNPLRLASPVIQILGILAVFAVLAIAGRNFGANSFSLYSQETIKYDKAVIVEITGEVIQEAEDMPGLSLGTQTVIVRFLNGALKGEEVEIANHLSYTHNIRVNVGTRVIVKADRPEKAEPYYTIYNYDRTPGIIALALILGALMAVVGRFKGIRSFLGLGVSLFIIIAFLLPAIYKGWPPVLSSLACVSLIAAFSIFLLNGFTLKAVAALASVMSGVLVSAMFYYLASFLLPLYGYQFEEAEELIMVSRATGLKIGEVMFSGVLVASIGAVIDMSVSVASSMEEVLSKRPDMTPKELFRSGMTVGGDMIGSMSSTLILAFVGSSLATLLALIAYGSQLDQILSSDYAAMEIAYGLTSSMAVIAAVPITAGLSALFYEREKGNAGRNGRKRRGKAQ